MSRLIKVLPVIAGAVAGAIVALLISSGGSTKTVTEVQVPASTASSAPAAATTSSTATSTTAASSSSDGPAGMTVNAIYKKDSPGVVDITAVTTTAGSSQGFFSAPSQTSEDEGAGVVFNKQGDILTDEHVVSTAKTVTVHFQDGVNATAKVLGTDASSDVAVIKVNVASSVLDPIPFANSNDARHRQRCEPQHHRAQQLHDPGRDSDRRRDQPR
jgi:serine protease Do